jgi:hypothetical protein
MTSRRGRLSSIRKEEEKGRRTYKKHIHSERLYVLLPFCFPCPECGRAARKATAAA